MESILPFRLSTSSSFLLFFVLEFLSESFDFEESELSKPSS